MKTSAFAVALLALLALLAGAGAAGGVTAPSAVEGGAVASRSRAQRVADAITELDVVGARRLLEETDTDSPAIVFERARLAVYLGDCDTASAILSVPAFDDSRAAAALADLARRCAGVVAAAEVVDDAKRGLWIRLQDHEDVALVPFISDVAVRARAAMKRDLGVELPRPLRIDLVRDLFSLSAVSGLLLEAAETTGTVAVARWGRVTMISPRATPLGFPWEDTLAHEITHLALSRATRDNAPLWLQEGIAKREETRWREPRPFDREPPPDSVARDALLTGRSVGVDRLGMSIAMLPSAEAASIAFSEVTSFMGFWVGENGTDALRLLLTDLRGVGDADAALRSVTGYDLTHWIERWRGYLRDLEAPEEGADDQRPEGVGIAGMTPQKAATDWRETVRHARLGELLFSRGHATAASDQLDAVLESGGRSAPLRARAARAFLEAGRSAKAHELVAEVADVEGPHGGWHALRGRFQREAGDTAAADESYRRGISLNPYAEEVACGGYWRRRDAAGKPVGEAPIPKNPDRRALCESARRVPLD